MNCHKSIGKPVRKKDRYKEKNCKFCEKIHNKRGLYCSTACANRDRPEYSEKVSEGMRKVVQEWNRTPAAIAKQKQLNTPLASMTADEFGVNIPDIQELSDYDYLDGYDRAEKW